MDALKRNKFDLIFNHWWYQFVNVMFSLFVLLHGTKENK